VPFVRRDRRGEQTATAMENQLSRLEERIDQLLASVEDSDQRGTTQAAEAVGARTMPEQDDKSAKSQPTNGRPA
jgi:ABC-type xylose transport system substrate-binding protein